MEELSIVSALIKAGMTVEAACAMGGNMMAESGMKANIAQRGMTKLTDEQYTAAADAGTIDFIGDSVGYGLCQWTLKARKRHLLEYANNLKKSVGDESLQVSFCLAELKTDYPSLWKFLCETHDAYKATERICREYEQPAVNNIEARYKYAQELYTKYGEVLNDGQWTMDNGQCAKDIDREPASYILAEVTNGRLPEAKYLAALLEKLGYDVAWSGIEACVRDFQQKTGLTVDGVCGEKTWREVLR
ncbi:MAG: phage tail tip lysozyme [Eubacteriales bacterium]|nr:phage tail tip lysozyme [Eubacteriales bacterium]